MKYQKRKPTPRHDAVRLSMDTLWQSQDHEFRTLVQLETMRHRARKAQRRIRPPTGAERCQALKT